MTSDDLVFIESELKELSNRAEHYRKQAEEARKHQRSVRPQGIEPWTRGLKVPCSAN